MIQVGDDGGMVHVKIRFSQILIFIRWSWYLFTFYFISSFSFFSYSFSEQKQKKHLVPIRTSCNGKTFVNIDAGHVVNTQLTYLQKPAMVSVNMDFLRFLRNCYYTLLNLHYKEWKQL